LASLINGLGGSNGFGTNTLARNDDGSSGSIDLTAIFPTGLSFYGVSFGSLYINNNGNLTLFSPSSAFTPSVLTGTSRAGFYAFWSDVDTLGGALSAPSPGGTSQGTNLVHWGLDAANHQLVVTWDDVGYFSRGTDRTNAFQIVIQDHSGDPGRSAGDFDLDYRYENIEWSGTGPSRAGYSNGDGISVELPASGNAAALLALPTTPGNTGISGVWHFEIRNAEVPDRVSLPLPPSGGFFLNEGGSGTSLFHLTAVRAGDLSGTLTVDWAVTGLGVNPANGGDFQGGVLPHGTVTFAAGEATADIAVPVQGDTAVEPDEFFRVTISNPVSSLGHEVLTPRATADVTILNDDNPPTLSITSSISGYEGDSGSTPFYFVLTRTGDLSEALTATVAIRAPGQFSYQASPNDLVGGERDVTVTIPAGEPSAALEVRVVGDTNREFAESFTVSITGFVGGAPGTTVAHPTGTGTILSDDGSPPGIFGDPHLVTLDNLCYDFQATGEFVLLEALPGAADPFQVQVRLVAWPSDPSVTWATRLAAQFKGAVVEIDGDAGTQLRINGQAVQLPSGPDGLDVDGDGASDVFRFESTYELRLGGAGETLVVSEQGGWLSSFAFLDPARADQVRGLLGDFDGIAANDLRLRDGTILAATTDPAILLGDFAESWRVGPNGIESSLFA